MADRATRGAFTALSETSRASVKEAANRFYEVNSDSTLGEMAERTLGVNTSVVSDMTASMMLGYLTAPETPGRITGLAHNLGGNGEGGGNPVKLGDLIPLSEETGGAPRRVPVRPGRRVPGRPVAGAQQDHRRGDAGHQSHRQLRDEGRGDAGNVHLGQAPAVDQLVRGRTGGYDRPDTAGDQSATLVSPRRLRGYRGGNPGDVNTASASRNVSPRRRGSMNSRRSSRVWIREISGAHNISTGTPAFSNGA